MKYSHQDYMNNKCDHETFYRQFVTDKTIKAVSNKFSSAIAEQKPLKEWGSLSAWDRVGLDSEATNLLNKAGMFWSLSNAICINKEAGEIICENFNN